MAVCATQLWAIDAWRSGNTTHDDRTSLGRLYNANTVATTEGSTVVLLILLGVTLLVAWFTGPRWYSLIGGAALMGYSALLFVFDLAARS
jgi:hypothetical protein